MRIDFSRLRGVTAREIESALLRDGFRLLRQKGSHRHYVHDAPWRRVTVSQSSGDTIRMGTLRNIIVVQAQWERDDLVRLGLTRN